MNYQEYRKAWDIASKGIKPEIPLNIDIEISSVCNLKCPMCPQSEMQPTNKKFMDIDLFKKIIDQAISIGVPAIKLNWRGEPTLHPKFEEMLFYVEGKFLDIRMNTNGTHGTGLIPQMLHICDKIIYSIDSLNQAVLDKIRPGIQMLKIAENFVEINMLKTLSKGKIIINFTIQKENENELINMGRWCETSGYEFNPRLMFPRTQKDHDFVSKRRKIKGPKSCGYPFQRLTISHDGLVHPCCVDWHDLEIVGDVKTESIMDIWDNEKMKIVRRAASCSGEIASEYVELCYHCTSWMGCEYENLNGFNY